MEGVILRLIRLPAFFLATVLLVSAASAAPLNTGNPRAPRAVSGIISEVENMVRHDAQQVVCVALAVYHEARGLSDTSQFAVASVVMNRARMESFPSNPCAVVWQRFAFSWTFLKRDRVPREEDAWAKAQRIAYLAYVDADTFDPTLGATHFHHVRLSPRWARAGYDVVNIEVHDFMKVE